MDKKAQEKIGLDKFLYDGMENLWVKGRDCVPVDIGDCVETIKRAIKLDGYRKIKDKPPLLDDEELVRHFAIINDLFPMNTEDKINTLYERIEANKKLAAQAQREADIKYYEGQKQ